MCNFDPISLSSFFEREMFQQKVVQKIDAHVLGSVFFFFKSYRLLLDNVEKYCGAVQATDDNVALAHFMLDT